ncbi:DNA glycosylase [Chlamydoabsidia padenii]|nr:DNA glycosylase [Chlamydoabsidia padenii]
MQRRSSRLAQVSPMTRAKRKSPPSPPPTLIKTEESSIKIKRQKKTPKQSTTPNDDWRMVFDKIKVYRQTHEAVVDTMGCERLAQPNVPASQQRFQTLVALMLSSQTKDTVTSAAVRSLQADLPGGLCLDSILAIDESQLDHHIRSVGFHTKKAGYIKKTAVILRDQYNGDIPDTIEGLTGLPGVGPKMGYLALQCAWQKNMGIGVDVHVHRIANRLGWCRTEGPEETRLSLQSWLPKEHWREINPMLVGFGQIMCLPRGPKCVECPVQDACPSSSSVKKTHKVRQVKSEHNDHGDIKLETTQIKQDVKEEESVYFKKPKQEDNIQVKKENIDW